LFSDDQTGKQMEIRDVATVNIPKNTLQSAVEWSHHHHHPKIKQAMAIR
jgi:hypothetical protein